MEQNIFDLLLTTWWLVPAAYQGLRNETIFPKEVSHHRHKNTFTWEQVFDKYTFYIHDFVTEKTTLKDMHK